MDFLCGLICFLNWGGLDWFEPETVLESTMNFLQVSHTASACGVSPLGLHAPVELSDLLFRVGT